MKRLGPQGKKRILAVLIAFVLIVGGLYAYFGTDWFKEPVLPQLPVEEAPLEPPKKEEELQPLEEEPAPQPTPEVLDDGLPHDKLFITVERQHYESGDLTLKIPKLSIDAPVWDGTAAEDLSHGACLYEYAQLPGEGNRNVSIAAHRDGRVNGQITQELFYYIDTLEEGDYLYLTDKENIYRYLYKDTKIVEANDWEPIKSQGFSCLTLTSCDPIGISSHRIIVRAELEETAPLEEDYEFASCQGEDLEHEK